MKRCLWVAWMHALASNCSWAKTDFNDWIMEEMAPHSLGRTTLLHKSVLPITMIFFHDYFLEKSYYKTCFVHLYIYWQENLAFARKSWICKKILHLQENLGFARKSCFCKISWLIETAMHSSKKMLHLQGKSCPYKKILHLQENLAKARNLCICNKILQKQEYLSIKCKGSVLETIQLLVKKKKTFLAY